MTETYGDRLAQFERDARGRIYQPRDLERLAALLSYLRLETDALPLPGDRDEVYHFDRIMDVCAPLSEWTEIERRVLAFMTRDAWAYMERNDLSGRDDERGYYELFFAWVKGEMTAPGSALSFPAAAAVLQERGIDEASIVRHALTELSDCVLDKDKGPTSVGRYLLEKYDAHSALVLERMNAALLELFMRFRRSDIEPHALRLAAMRTCRTRPGTRHIRKRRMKVLCGIDPETYGPVLLSQLADTDCPSCRAAAAALLLDCSGEGRRETAFGVARDVFARLADEKNKNPDFCFNWFGHCWGDDETAAYVEWALKRFGKEALPPVLEYVRETAVIDLDVVAAALRVLGRDAISVGLEALRTGPDDEGAGPYFRRLFSLLRPFDFSAGYGLVWKIAAAGSEAAREAACLALSAAGDAAVAARATEALRSRKKGERRAAVIVLCLLDTPAGRKVLKPLLKTEKDDGIRNHIVQLFYHS